MLAAAALVSVLLLQDAAAPVSRTAPPTPREKAHQLLDDALDFAPGAQPEVAASGLLRIGENYDAFDSAKALKILRQAFAASLSIPPGSEERREQAQSQIALYTVPLSLPDAVSMLKSIVISTPAKDALRQDPRQPAIEAAIALLVGKKQVDEAIQFMNEVGANGQYPFAAARTIFEKLPPDDVRRPAIFSYALSAYTLRPAPEFGEFLVKHWKEIPRSTAEAAIRQVVENVLSQKDEGLNETLAAEKGPITLHGRHNVELFDLMHVVRAIDPKRAEEILEGRPELKAALTRFPGGREDMGQLGNWSRSDGALDPPDERSTEMARVMADLDKVPDDLAEDKKFARYVEIAKAIRNPSLRLEILSSTIEHAGEADPLTGKSILSECIDLVKGVKDPQLRTQAWASIAASAHRLGDDKLAHEALDHAFDDAAILYKLDLDPDEPNPGPRDQWPSTNAYRRVVIAGAKVFGVDADVLLGRISDPDIALFARIEMAQALLDRPHNMWMTWSGKTIK